ncbi:efflux RND transporter periplasmic adaptor subunit [Methylocaldum sp. BRCS4]|nr:efflux RND transporter periplasmic adaptor subunit [Methylocaldum sp. BRCS4]
MKQSSLIAALLLIGLVLAGLILTSEPPKGPKEDEHGAGEAHENEIVRGPHGGRLLSRDGFALEITIYEKGVPPRFRVYVYENDKPLPPEAVALTFELHRLGNRIDRIRFHKEADYLLGDEIVEEPHSFDVKANAEYAGKTYDFAYSQVEGRVALAPESLQSAGIEVKTAGPATIETVLELPGEILFDQNRLAHVVPRVAAVAVEVRKELGDGVRRGEVIAVLESRDLADLKSQYATAVKRLALARSLFEREERLWREKISAQQDYLAARTQFAEAEIALTTARQQLAVLGIDRTEIDHIGSGGGASFARYELRAPLDGQVIEKHTVTGEAVQADTTVFVIADLSTVWGEFSVPAKDLNRVRLGQKVRLKAPALDLEAEAPVAYLGPLVGEQTRAAPAHVHLPNPEGRWRAGLFVTVEVVQEETTVPVAVAAVALQTWRDFQVVFARYGDQFEVRPLELGRRDRDFVEVIKGLSAGERYAAGNSFVLKAELGKAGATHEH